MSQQFELQDKMRIVQELVPGRQITLAHVIANPDKQVTEVLVAPVEQATAAKTAKKTATKKPTAKKPAAKKAPAKKAEAKKDGFVRVEVGEKMPYYLL